ncbi:MAG TPA: ABC transporter permease [Vicinamibacteria bacterium]
MGKVRRTLARLLGFFGLGPSEKVLDEELRFHLAELTRAHEHAGHAPEEAARRAKHQLTLETTKEEWRDERSFPAVESIVQDLRHAARGLRRDPAFTSAAVLTLALGLAASTVVYSLIQGVLLRPLPYPEPDRLVRVFETSARFARWPVSPLDFVDFAERAKAFAGFGAWTRVDLELSSGAKPLRLRSLQVSPGYFTVLGARPALGRSFEERELRGDPRVVILSHRLWQERFGADPGVLGRVLRLDRRDFTVVGVMPAGFEHVGGDYRSLPQGEHVDAWWPLVLDAEKVNRGWHYVNVVARLAPTTTFAQADADMERVAAELRQQYPDTNKGWRVTLQPLRDELVGNGTSALMLLAAAVGLLLLTACANVASLLLARATTRQPEIAMRHALGASRTRLVRLGLAEAAVLAVTSGVVGVILARLMLPALLRLLPSDFARLHAVRLDTGVLLFSFLLCGLVALLFGLAPAVQGSSGDLRSALHSDGRSGTASASTLRWRGFIVVSEVTLACALLVAAGLLARSFAALVRTDPGFDPSGAVAFDLFLPQAGYAADGAKAAFHARLEERLRALPGVKAAGATTALPWSGWDENTGFDIVGDRQARDSEPNARFGAASPGFFDGVGLSLKRGRFFTASDVEGAPYVVVVNEALARKYFPGEDPVGRTLEIWDHKPVIVGVVGDVKDAPADVEAKPAFLWPLAQQTFPATTVVVRADVPGGLYESVRAAVAAVDPELPVTNLRPLAEVARDAHARRRFLLSMVATFAALALLLAAVGAYGVLSYAVERRRREIGIRLALGADSNRILRDVLGQSLRLAVRGVVLGLALALVLAHLMRSLLYGITARDPLTLLAAAVTILIVSTLAAAHPAWRATRSEPARILRSE